MLSHTLVDHIASMRRANSLECKMTMNHESMEEGTYSSVPGIQIPVDYARAVLCKNGTMEGELRERVNQVRRTKLN